MVINYTIILKDRKIRTVLYIYNGVAGFKVINSACCGLGRNRAEIPCPHDSIPCRNRSDHFFWDAFHPTEAANIFISKRFFRAQNPTDAYPFDIHRLALLRNHFT